MAHTNCERDFDKDKSELDPEGYAEDRVLAVLDSEALVLDANEDGRDDVAGTVHVVSIGRICEGIFILHEDHQHGVVNVWIAQCVEDGQQDETSGANDCSDHTNDATGLLDLGCVVCQSTSVSEPSFRNECQIEHNDCDCASGDEERFETLRADVRDVCDMLSRAHARIMRASLYNPGG